MNRGTSELAFFINLQRAIIGPSADNGRYRFIKTAYRAEIRFNLQLMHNTRKKKAILLYTGNKHPNQPVYLQFAQVYIQTVFFSKVYRSKQLDVPK